MDNIETASGTFEVSIDGSVTIYVDGIKLKFDSGCLLAEEFQMMIYGVRNPLEGETYI